MRRRALATGVAAALLGAGASPAPAAMTIGQLDPSPGVIACFDDFDRVQVAVGSGNEYSAPGNGTIISWSTNARAAAGQLLGLKVYARIADPDAYRVVGIDGPRPLSAAGGLHTFATSIPVQTGQRIGLTIPPSAGSPACAFAAGSAADSIRSRAGNLGNGATGSFDQVASGLRLNVSAVFVPSNTITVGRTTRNKKKGTATVEITVPNAGELTASGNGLGATIASGARPAVAVPIAGTVKLTVRAKGKKRKKLNEKGKAKVTPTITYTPRGGDTRTQSVKVKLKKKLKK